MPVGSGKATRYPILRHYEHIIRTEKSLLADGVIEIKAMDRWMLWSANS